jgi:hypothetical protein
VDLQSPPAKRADAENGVFREVTGDRSCDEASCSDYSVALISGMVKERFLDASEIGIWRQ